MERIKLSSWKGKVQIRCKLSCGEYVSDYEANRIMNDRPREIIPAISNGGELLFVCNGVLPFDKWLKRCHGSVGIYPLLKQINSAMSYLYKIGLSVSKLCLHPSYVCMETHNSRLQFPYFPINGCFMHYDPVVFLKDLTCNPNVIKEDWHSRLLKCQTIQDLFELEKWLDKERERQRELQSMEYPTDVDEQDDPPTSFEDELPTGLDAEDDDEFTNLDEEEIDSEPTEAMLLITHLCSDGKRQSKEVNTFPYIIGRSKQKAAWIIDKNPKVSNVHVVITKENGFYYMEDNSSTNGTFINNERIRPNSKIMLHDGMEFRLYNEVFSISLQ